MLRTQEAEFAPAKELRPKMVAILEGYLEPDRALPVAVPKRMLKHTAVRLMNIAECGTFAELVASIIYNYSFINTSKQSFFYLFNPFYPLFTKQFETLYQPRPFTIEFLRKQFYKFLVYRNVTVVTILNPLEPYTDDVMRFMKNVNREYAIPHIESLVDLKEAINIATIAFQEVFNTQNA